MISLVVGGDEHGAFEVAQELLRAAGGRPGKAHDRDFLFVDYMTWNLPSMYDAYQTELRANTVIVATLAGARARLLDAQIRLHDPDAWNTLESIEADPGDYYTAAIKHLFRSELAAEAGHLEEASTEAQAYAASATTAISSEFPGYICQVARIEEAAGYHDKADAVLNGAGTFVDCARFRADILNGRGDWPGAQAAYAAAVALVPESPAAYYSWGLALARHGDLGGAPAKFSDAHQHGPNWADPLKSWGDVLAQQGKSADAAVIRFAA
jgi:tetratricopeptide (TPR) repeat protein